MQCLNCGKENEHLLCSDCLSERVLDEVYNSIRFYKPEICENEYIRAYVESFENLYASRDHLPEIFDLFDKYTVEYYYCRYYKLVRDEKFEEAAISYLKSHDLKEDKTQLVLCDLLDSYLRNDFVKPRKWCEMICKTEYLCCELYYRAAQYFAMVAEYDVAEQLILSSLEKCNDLTFDRFLIYSREKEIESLEKLRKDNERYRTKKPYWPTTEERRRAVAAIYDEKGISYPRITSKPKKVKECDFVPISECFEDELSDYCTFWCNEAFSISSVKSIYQIGAVKVAEDKIVDTFEAFIRPWDGGVNARKSAAKEVGVSVEIIESAEDIDLVMPKFFTFVGDDVLVSTGALGNQAKLMSRAARYAGMKEIKNEFYDLLDLAADTSEEFDLANNTREYCCVYLYRKGCGIYEKANSKSKGNNFKLYSWTNVCRYDPQLLLSSAK